VSTSGSRLRALRRLPRDPADFYAISDMDSIRRMGGWLWIFGGLSTLIVMAVWPPTGRIGGAGIAVAGGVVGLGLLTALSLLRWPERISPDLLLWMSFLATAMLMLLVWVGGEPYS
jgi:hypothetical protein